MRVFFTLFVAQVFWLTSFGQQYNHYRTEVCGDTVVIEVDMLKMLPKNLNDTATSYREIQCTRISNFGIRFDIGISGYTYNKNTSLWLGNHQGSSFGLVLTFRHINLGVRWKPWTVTPKNNLTFGSDTLTNQYKLNPIKTDYFIGYSVDFKYNISIEPYLGYSRNSFRVINEADFFKHFSIPKSGGLICGLSLNKYFALKGFDFISTFFNFGYSFADFRKVNTNLGQGYIEWTFGLAYKAFATGYKYHRIE